LNSYLSVEDRILRRVEFRQKTEPKDRDFSRIFETFQLIGDHFTTKNDITSMYKMFNFLDEETNKSKSLFIIFTTKLIENLPGFRRTSLEKILSKTIELSQTIQIFGWKKN
jgi:hypothetical protein